MPKKRTTRPKKQTTAVQEVKAQEVLEPWQRAILYHTHGGSTANDPDAWTGPRLGGGLSASGGGSVIEIEPGAVFKIVQRIF